MARKFGEPPSGYEGRTKGGERHWGDSEREYDAAQPSDAPSNCWKPFLHGEHTSKRFRLFGRPRNPEGGVGQKPRTRIRRRKYDGRRWKGRRHDLREPGSMWASLRELSAKAGNSASGTAVQTYICQVECCSSVLRTKSSDERTDWRIMQERRRVLRVRASTPASSFGASVQPD